MGLLQEIYDNGWLVAAELRSPDRHKKLYFYNVVEWRMGAYSSPFLLSFDNEKIDFGTLKTFGWGNLACWSQDSRYFALPVLKDGMSFFIFDTERKSYAVIPSDYNHYRFRFSNEKINIEDGTSFEFTELVWDSNK